MTCRGKTLSDLALHSRRPLRFHETRMGLHFPALFQCEVERSSESAQNAAQSLKVPDDVLLVDVIGKQIDRIDYPATTP